MRLQKYFASIENYEEKELKNKDEFAFNTFWIKVNCHWNLHLKISTEKGFLNFLRLLSIQNLIFVVF